MLTFKERETTGVILQRMVERAIFHLFMDLKVRTRREGKIVRMFTVFSTTIRFGGMIGLMEDGSKPAHIGQIAAVFN